MKRHNRLLAALGVLVLSLSGGCASTAPKIEHYLLAAQPGGSVDGEQNPSLVVGLREIRLPDYLERRGLLRQTKSHRLKISQQQRWAESMAAGVQRVTTLNLNSRMASTAVRSPPWTSAEQPDWLVDITLLDFVARGQKVVLDATIHVHGPNTTVISRSVALSTDLPAEADGNDLARTHSELLARLADEIVAIIANTHSS